MLMKMKTELPIIALCLCAILSAHAIHASNPDEMGQKVKFEGEEYIRVTNPRQFVCAIASGQNILVAKNTELNLSPVLNDEQWWKNANQYFKWVEEYACIDLKGENIASEEVFDGRQLSIVGYKNLKIVGEGNSRIIVEPRYAYSLNFVGCQNITIRNLTLGHTEGGYCTGGVIGTSGGANITIYDSDLFGCGAYGLDLKDTRDFGMYDSSIHDCTYGIMTLVNVNPAVFQGCKFYRNREFCLITSHVSDVSFTNCQFYSNNPTSPLFCFDNNFTLSQSYILHPTQSLGTIELAREDCNWYNDDPDDIDFIGGGIGPEEIKINYSGSQPSILDFVNATIGDGFSDENECERWVNNWKQYQRTKKTASKYDSYIIDNRNGYVRIESKYDEEDEVKFHDFCYWNCADGKHKLFARSSGLLIGGKSVETECTGLWLYLYDNDTHIIKYIGTDKAFRPKGSNEITYLLPRKGKDITYIDASGKRGILRWNGNGFGNANVTVMSAEM